MNSVSIHQSFLLFPLLPLRPCGLLSGLCPRFNLQPTHSLVSLIPLDLWRPHWELRLPSGTTGHRKWERGEEVASLPVTLYAFIGHYEITYSKTGSHWAPLTLIHFHETLKHSVNIAFFLQVIPAFSPSSSLHISFHCDRDLGLFGLKLSLKD